MWHDLQSNTLIYDLENPEVVLKHVPDARRLHNGYTAFPVTLHNLQVLKYFKLPVLPIMDMEYDWPISPPFKPTAHQRVMANFMALNPIAFNLSDMGTMKTLATLWAADYVMTKHQCRTLILAPLSTLQRVWGDAIFRHFMGRRSYVILHGAAQKRLELLRQPADFYLLNHDGLKVGAKPKERKIELTGFVKDLSERQDIRVVAIDEARAFSDHMSLRSRVARLVLKREYLWQLTGTPIPNGPLDAYGLAKLANNAKGESFKSYKSRVMVPGVSAFKWHPRAGAHKDAMEMLQPSVRFAIEDCWELPPLTVQQRDVDLSDAQQKLYKQLKKECQAVMSTGQITAVNEAALRIKLLQVACGVVYDGAKKGHFVDCKPRLSVLREVISECGGKAIIFAPFTSVISMLSSELKGHPLRVVNGAVPHRERNDIFQWFQSDKPGLLLADPGTIAHGIDLFASACVVWYCPTDKTELYLQGNKRIHRPGQTRACTIVQLASTPIEREIYKRIDANESLQGLVLQLAREG